MTVTKEKFYIVKPKASENICTNPSFEVATTGFGSGGSNTIATSTAQSRRGVKSCLCTYQDNDALLTYVQVLTATTYTFSADIYIPATYDGTDLVLSAFNFTSAAITVGRPNMAIRDKWQRIHAHITPDGGDLSGSIYIYEAGVNATAGRFIYVDGVQIELGATETTYFDGDILETIKKVKQYYWAGQAHASKSYRLASTRSGGELIDITTYCKKIDVIGLGIAPTDVNSIDLTDGTKRFQRTNLNSRYFTLSVVFNSTNIGGVQASRNAMINLVKPDLVTYQQPLIIRYQGETDAGVKASEPIDIKCVYVSGLDTALQRDFERANIVFEISGSYLQGAYDSSETLNYQTTITHVNGIIQRSVDGIWSKMGTGVLGPTAIVWMDGMNVHPITGELWAFGDFVSAGGIANTEYLAKWNGSVWNYVISAMTGTVMDVEFDAAGNAFIGGVFLNAAAVPAADNICMFDGSTVTGLGTGANGGVYAIAISPNGTVYAGGDFTLAGGVANTVKIAKWDGSVWTPLLTGLNNYVNAIAIKSDTEVYIAGAFTDVAGGTTDYIVMWNGIAFSALGTGMNGEVNALCIDNNGKLIAGGSFTSAGGVAGTSKIARWTGLQWEPAGNLTTGFDDDVLTLFKGIDGTIYAGGRFTKADNVTFVDPAAMMKNNMWMSLDINLNGGEVEGFAEKIDGTFYICLHTGEDISAISATVTTPNTPTATSYPVIKITGPGQIWQIKNYTTGKAIYFNDLTLLAGEVITLDLRPGKISITSTFRGSILPYVLPGSSYDFPLLPGSNNVSAYLFGSTSAASGIVMTWKDNYHGIDGASYV